MTVPISFCRGRGLELGDLGERLGDRGWSEPWRRTEWIQEPGNSAASRGASNSGTGAAVQPHSAAAATAVYNAELQSCGPRWRAAPSQHPAVIQSRPRHTPIPPLGHRRLSDWLSLPPPNARPRPSPRPFPSFSPPTHPLVLAWLSPRDLARCPEVLVFSRHGQPQPLPQFVLILAYLAVRREWKCPQLLVPRPRDSGVSFPLP